jgi:hypothetical protein
MSKTVEQAHTMLEELAMGRFFGSVTFQFKRRNYLADRFINETQERANRGWE